ncbi:hypothetical protein FUA23_21075 [Neolewinella aurantiaca]|uniref:Uncharacterized protein n=1 Tax=Neolewinella aurantiaca TaxID=2602767 RepID=A0A5C7FJM2_9BACT|nr:hypothetical protein [Neolewinella aurantiaca]TXF84706.1 hypothetical protein FUA23_21075 [Neolewinella aurantiaca]
MTRLPCLLLLISLFCSCGGRNFDESKIPADQRNTELAFKRMAQHGGLEPVLEENQNFANWQFHVSSVSETSVLGSDPVKNLHLNDRSGIEYIVSSASTPEAVLDGIDFGYGFASGKVISVERDLAAGEIIAEISLLSWKNRD